MTLLLVLAASPGLISAQVVYQLPFDSPGDGDVALWTVIGSAFSSLAHDPNEDVVGSPVSGSLGLLNEGTIASATAQFQLCVSPAVPGQAFQVQLAARIPTGQSESGWMSIVLTATDQLDCFGNSVGSPLGSTTSLLSTPSASWTTLLAAGTPVPTGAQSMSIRVLMNKTQAAGSLAGLIDDVLVERTDLFADGFESGNTSMWSSAVP